MVGIEKETEFKQQLPESFGVEFLNTGIITDKLPQMDFHLTSSKPEGVNKVVIEGERNDGTKIEIIITKGENYKSPAEIEAEIADEN